MADESVVGSKRDLIPGLKVLKWSLITSTVASSFSVMIALGYSSVSFDDPVKAMALISMLAVLSLFLFIFEILCLVATIVGTIMLRRSNSGAEAGLRRDLNAALLASAIITVSMFVIPFVSGFLTSYFMITSHDPMKAAIFLTGYLQFFGLLSLAAWVLTVILPVRCLVDARTRRNLYISAMAWLVLSLLETAIKFVIYRGFSGLDDGRSLAMMMNILRVLSIVINIIPILAYSKTIRVLSSGGSTSKDIGIPSFEERLPRFIRRDLDRPAVYLVYAALAGIILAIPLSLTYANAFDRERNFLDLDEFIGLYDGRPIFEGEEFTGNLRDGESAEYELEVNGTLGQFLASLQWQDETVGTRWTNDPDGFSINVMILSDDGQIMDTLVETGENDESGEGRLDIGSNYSEKEGFLSVTVLITVTLETTGDYHGRLLGLMTRTDDMNDYLLEVAYSHSPEEPPE